LRAAAEKIRRAADDLRRTRLKYGEALSQQGLPRNLQVAFEQNAVKRQRD
jgi:hypothetical protein